MGGWRRALRLLCLLAIGLSACAGGGSRLTDEERVSWLSRHALRVRSIDPDDDDFSDLQPLREIMGDARVVMLGEQSHGDGSTFLAKVRLVRFLHQEMGFDVLAFESGFYDCARAWRLIQEGEEASQAFSQAVFSIWSQSEQVQPLTDYIEATVHSDRPLELAGFDSQFTGSASRVYLISDLEAFLVGHGLAAAERAGWEDFTAVLANLARGAYVNLGEPLPSAEEQEGFRRSLDMLGAEIASTVGMDDPEASFWLQVLESIGVHARQMWHWGGVGAGAVALDPVVVELRDIQMGRNLVWLANRIHPDRRIVVWAATVHIARNLERITTGDASLQEYYDRVTVMGDVVWEALGEQVYTLGFTAYDGAIGVGWEAPTELEVPSRGSLEDLMNRAGLEVAIVDFRDPPEGGEWLRDRMVSRPLGYTEMTADWTQVLDGMMIIRHMTPNTSLRPD